MGGCRVPEYVRQPYARRCAMAPGQNDLRETTALWAIVVSPRTCGSPNAQCQPECDARRRPLPGRPQSARGLSSLPISEMLNELVYGTRSRNSRPQPRHAPDLV